MAIVGLFENVVSDGTADDSSVPPFVGSSLEESSYSLTEGLDEKATDGDIVGVGVILSEGGTERGTEDGCNVLELGACDDDS